MREDEELVALIIGDEGQDKLKEITRPCPERNKWLRASASPLELKAEARYETQAQVAASQQAQADASLQAQKQRDQYAGYKPLPAHIDRTALIKASKDELRKWSRLYGQFQLNTALRGQQ